MAIFPLVCLDDITVWVLVLFVAANWLRSFPFNRLANQQSFVLMRYAGVLLFGFFFSSFGGLNHSFGIGRSLVGRGYFLEF